MTWYCLTKPPNDATSATPGTDCSAVAQVPVLERAQVGRGLAPAVVDERVLEDPAHAGGVGTQLGAARPAGRSGWILLRYSSTRLRAQ